MMAWRSSHAFAGAVLAALLLVTCRPSSAPTPENLAQFEAATSVRLPRTAHVVGVEREERDYWRAKMVLSQQDWLAFLETMPVDEEELFPGTGGFLGLDDGWWDPHQFLSLRTGQVQRETGAWLTFGVDDTDPNAVAVFIVQFGP